MFETGYNFLDKSWLSNQYQTITYLHISNQMILARISCADSTQLLILNKTIFYKSFERRNFFLQTTEMSKVWASELSQDTQLKLEATPAES